MKKIIFLFLIINILSIASCCNDEHKIVGTTSFNAFSLVEGIDINPVTDNFVLTANLEIEIASIDLSNPFVNELYGTSCDFDITNPVIEESITLVCDKDFTVNGVTVAAGDNLIDLGSVSLDDTVESISVIFVDDFTDAADFPDTDDYEFTIAFDTNDGLSLTNSISLDMQL